MLHSCALLYKADKCPCASCMFLMHPAPTCADGYWYPVPLTFSNLCWWCFSFQQLAQTLDLHLWWLPSATCAGGLFPRSTGAYTACIYCNLHCVVVVVVVVVVYTHCHNGSTRGALGIHTSEEHSPPINATLYKTDQIKTCLAYIITVHQKQFLPVKAKTNHT